MASADNLEICLCREGIDITLDKGNYNEEEFEEEMLQVIVHQEILGSSYELEPLKTYEPLKAKRSKESCFYDFYTPPPDIKDQNQNAIEEPVGVIVKSGVDQVRLHWPLLMHCFHSLFATPIPALNFPTRGGRWLWREWGHNRIADSTYVKDIIRGVNNTVLLFHVHKHPHFEEIYIPELLLKIKQLDDLSVAHFLKVCYQFFSIQRKVFSASFDNARVNEFQAAVMITGIARGSGGFTKCLYTWNVCEFKIEDEASTLFTESVKLYTNLSLLSINFSVLGNRLEGLELICHLIGGTKKKLILQLLVQSLTDGEVNDKRWRQTAAKCPGLMVRMLLVVVPKYQEIRKFFSKWMPLQEICIFCNWRTQNMASWCLECTLQMLSTFYGEKLERIYLQVCRQPELINLCSFFIDGRPSLVKETSQIPGYLYPQEFLLPALKKLEILTNMDLEDIKKLCNLLITSRNHDHEIIEAEKVILRKVRKIMMEKYYEKSFKKVQDKNFRKKIEKRVRNRLRLMEAKELLHRYKDNSLPKKMFYNTIYECDPDQNTPEGVTKTSEKNVWMCPSHCVARTSKSSIRSETNDEETDRYTFYEPVCEHQAYEDYECALPMDAHESVPTDVKDQVPPFPEEEIPPRPPSIALETLVLRLYPPYSTTVHNYHKMVNEVYDQYAQKLKDCNIKFRLDVLGV